MGEQKVAHGGGDGAGGGCGGSFGGAGGGEGQPELTVSAPVTHWVLYHQIHCEAWFGHVTDVNTDAIDDQSVPGEGPISHRPPPSGMKYR